MTGYASFNATVAARTRAAQAVKAMPELFAAFLAKGGLVRDLDAIAESGLQAQAHDVAQSGAAASGIGATGEALAAFDALQREYKAVMAIAQAVEGDLMAQGAPPEVIATIVQILVDETAVHLKTTKGEDGKSVKKAYRKASQEAIRAEIWRDASALAGFAHGAALFAERGVDAARLVALRAAAEALTGKLSAMTVKKGERKAHTKAEGDAVRAQRHAWGASYRILASVEDPRMAELLKAARG